MLNNRYRVVVVEKTSQVIFFVMQLFFNQWFLLPEVVGIGGICVGR
jgi:hypothetical protein